MTLRACLPLLSVALLWLASCSSDGKTPECPALPLYDVRDAESRASVRDALIASAEKGCITLPADLEAEGGAGGAAP